MPSIFISVKLFVSHRIPLLPHHDHSLFFVCTSQPIDVLSSSFNWRNLGNFFHHFLFIILLSLLFFAVAVIANLLCFSLFLFARSNDFFQWHSFLQWNHWSCIGQTGKSPVANTKLLNTLLLLLGPFIFCVSISSYSDAKSINENASQEFCL